MSIYGTGWCVDATDHDDDCPRWNKNPTTEDIAKAGTLMVGENTWVLGDGHCQCGPIVYQGSHILPADDHEHGGIASIGFIPGFIGCPDRAPLNDDYEDQPYHPWMRLSVNQEDVVLDRKHVTGLRDWLTWWLDNTKDAS